MINPIIAFSKVKIFFLILSLSTFFPTDVFSDCIFQKEIEVQELEIGNLISWITASEKGNEKFIVQKSEDGISFSDLGFLDGAGTTEISNNYKFLDTKIGVEKSYYRLTIVNEDGTEFNTPTFLLNRKKSNNFMVTGLSSTVIAEDFSIEIQSVISGELMVKTSSASQSFDFNWKVAEGKNLYLIDLHNASIGIYEIEFTMNNETEKIYIEKVLPGTAPILKYVVKD